MNISKTFLARTGITAAVLLIFLAVSALCFAPQFGGEQLPQHDVLQYDGMTQDIRENRTQTGEDPQWTGRMFGGMPAYLINVAYPAQVVKQAATPVVGLLDTPAAFLFFACTAMWLMLLMMGVGPWVALVGALGYGLSTYFFLIIGAGHITKMWAAVYAPLMMGGAWLTLRRNMWVGAALTALFTSLEIGANHPQITYYFLMAMAAFWISELVAAVRKHTLRRFAVRTALLAAAGLLAVGSNFAPLWYTAQHTPDTIRGGSELASSGTNATAGQTGLDLDYATAWSYGRTESFNLLIPDLMGGDSGRGFSTDGPVAAALNDYGLAGDIASQLPTYWGDQPYTAGPTYLGATLVFLAVLGCLLLNGRNRWWIIVISLIMLLAAWGRHFMGFTELMFRLLPGYDKFRTVSMTLVVVQWSVPLLAAGALWQLWKGQLAPRKVRRALIWAVSLTGGLCLLFAVAGGALFDFGRDDSAAMMTEQFHYMFSQAGLQEYIDRGVPEEMGLALGDAMAAERLAIMQGDAWRSLGFILVAAAAVWLLAVRRHKRGALVAATAALVLLDLVPVDLRYLPYDRYVSPRSNRITATEADREILADKELGFRVLNLTVSPFNDATTSYFHRSVGGYHGAKLARYQDLIDHYLAQGNDEVLDLLNTKYVIVPSAADGRPTARLRGTQNGAAWFVDRLLPAASAREEIDLLGRIDTRTEAVVAASVTDSGIAAAPAADSLAARQIALTEYRPNYLKYEYTTSEPAVAVFSEIYYDKGWKAFIDGREAPYFRADYVLRAMQLPAGRHTVEWRFRAPGWSAIEAVTLVSSLVILGGVAAVCVVGIVRYRRRRTEEAERSNGTSAA